MKYSFIRNLFLILLGFTFLASTNSCTKEEEDPCLKSDAALKVVNVRVYLQVVTQSAVPVFEENVNITVSHFACGSDITLTDDAVDSEYFGGITNEDGIFESDIVNFVMSNTQGRIVANGVAPNLDYYLQNYHREIKYYSDMNGAGLDEIYLTVIKKD